MPRGGKREGAGRKPKHGAILTIEHKKDEFDPRVTGKFERMPPREFKRGELSPVEVMQENLEFYHKRAGQILAAIFHMTAGATEEEQKGKQFQALLHFADSVKMRVMAQEVANQLAKYRARPMGQVPFGSKIKDEEKPDPRDGAIDVIPMHPGVQEAYERAAAGLPPEPRKVV